MRRSWMLPFWIGVSFLVLGLGNWWVGSEKVQEHLLLQAHEDDDTFVVSHEGFPNLSPETNRSLLQPFRVPLGRAATTQQKLEFYRTVEFGGRVLVLVGAFTILIGLGMHRWTSRRNPS